MQHSTQVNLAGHSAIRSRKLVIRVKTTVAIQLLLPIVVNAMGEKRDEVIRAFVFLLNIFQPV